MADTADATGADAKCPVCNTDRYLNPNMVILVSPCYHKMCEGCVGRIFASGAQPCPVCRMTLRKTNFVRPTFESVVVEKECQVRKRIARIFNKRQEEFDNLREYNDYLEEVEEIVFNLVNNLDVQAMNARIEAYREQNASTIERNAEAAAREKAELTSILLEDALEQQQRKQADLQRVHLEQVERDRSRRDMVDDLSSSKLDANAIVAQYNRQQQLAMTRNAITGTGTSAPPIASSLEQKLLRMNRLKLPASSTIDNSMIIDPLASPYERLPLKLRQTYTDVYAVVRFDTLDRFTTDQHKAGGYTIRVSFEKALVGMMDGLFV